MENTSVCANSTRVGRCRAAGDALSILAPPSSVALHPDAPERKPSQTRTSERKEEKASADQARNSKVRRFRLFLNWIAVLRRRRAGTAPGCRGKITAERYAPIRRHLEKEHKETRKEITRGQRGDHRDSTRPSRVFPRLRLKRRRAFRGRVRCGHAASFNRPAEDVDDMPSRATM